MDTKTRADLPNDNDRLESKTIETQSTFPDDIVEEILSRLPVKQLLRLRCVSKPWCDLIDSLSFIKKQHEKQYAIFKEEGDIPLFLEAQRFPVTFEPNEFYLLSKRYGGVLLNVTPDLERDSAPHVHKNSKPFRDLRVLGFSRGFANGVALLQWGDIQWGDIPDLNSDFGLWNPATRDFKVVPPNRSRSYKIFWSGMVALGFDPKFDDFKILRAVAYEPLCMYEIYSLNKDTWKTIIDPHPNHRICSSFGYCNVYMNGVYYWSCEILEPRRANLILSFDFSDEAFKVLDPPFVKCHCLQVSCVAKYMESLAVICTNESFEHPFHNYEFWVMTSVDDLNLGVTSSWKHLFTFGPLPGSGILCFHSCQLDGDVLIRVHGTDGDRNQETILYNPTTSTESKRFGLLFCCCSEYVESLFPLSKRHVDI